MPEERVDDNGMLSSDFVFSEEVPDGLPILPQALWFGVRPGYDGDGKRLPEPTIWVQYQERHMAAPLTGLVAISPESWDKIDEAVRWRFAEWKEIHASHAVHPSDPGTCPLRDSTEADQRAAFHQPALPSTLPGGDSNAEGQVT